MKIKVVGNQGPIVSHIKSLFLPTIYQLFKITLIARSKSFKNGGDKYFKRELKKKIFCPATLNLYLQSSCLRLTRLRVSCFKRRKLPGKKT